MGQKAVEEEEEEWCKRGARVEVCLEDEGFRGSWYTATVLNHHPKKKKKKKKKIEVEFETLVVDEKSNTKNRKKTKKNKKRKVLLREWVDLLLVRPLPPPPPPERRFEVDEEVDGFHKDGWWEGVVTDVIHVFHPQQQQPYFYYSVFFRSSREQLIFPHSRLRLHREWVYGHWVPPPPSSSSSSSSSSS